MFLFTHALAEATTAAEATLAPEATAAPAQTSAIADFFTRAFSKFGTFDWTTWLILGVLAALGLILLAAARSAKKWNARMLAYGALSIALSFVLSYIRLFRMPQGGSITPGSMLPLLLFSAAFGAGPGVVAGLAYGLLQYLQGGDFLNVWQFLLDYPIAFAALGLAGAYRWFGKKWQLYLALALAAAGLGVLCAAYPENWVLYLILFLAVVTLFVLYIRGKKDMALLPAMFLGVLGRAVSAVCAGLIWVAEYPVEGQLPFVYSLTYNGAYLLPELVICMALAWVLGDRMLRLMRTGNA